jgi:aspartate/methionine/tyrosine aminotransferase
MSPANPSGAMIGQEELGRIAETCRRLNLRLVSTRSITG